MIPLVGAMVTFRTNAINAARWCADATLRVPGKSLKRRTKRDTKEFHRTANMTGMLEHETPGLGHNKPSEEDADEIKHGSHLYKKLLEEPRVYSSKDHPWKGGPSMYGKHVISPQAVNIVQSIESHIECYAPLNAGQKHGHLNSAVFYVLKGHGHDIHDGRYIKWQAGDVMLVENGCVHQHFNDDENEDCILLVFKAKPLFLFMHLLFQKMVEWPTDKLPPGHEDFKPPTDI
jgi:mannose-6-phosphate isomerase-like protein (cupin superfamily)